MRVDVEQEPKWSSQKCSTDDAGDGEAAGDSGGVRRAEHCRISAASFDVRCLDSVVAVDLAFRLIFSKPMPTRTSTMPESSSSRMGGLRREANPLVPSGPSGALSTAEPRRADMRGFALSLSHGGARGFVCCGISLCCASLSTTAA